jgi:hypothetical protein
MSNASAVHVTVFRLTRHDMSPEQAEALHKAVEAFCWASWGSRGPSR